MTSDRPFDLEWGIIEDAFDAMAGMYDIPYYSIETAFDALNEEYERYPDCPPSMTLQNVLNRFETFYSMAKTDDSKLIFESCTSVIENILLWYLQDILFYGDDEIEDWAYEQVAIPTYFSKDEYEYMRKEYLACG